MNREMVYIGIFAVLFSAVSCQKNVLFIVSDDMRPQLGAYMGPDYPSDVDLQMHTPNLDNLASESLLLTRAYVQQAVCSPSRTSYMTSRRPDTTHVYDLIDYWREVGGNFTTLPQYFKENGYRSFGMGKIYHPNTASGHDEDAISWNEPYFIPENKPIYGSRNNSWLALSPEDIADYGPLADEDLTIHAIEVLQGAAQQARTGEQPFFIALGFYLPHLPFIFPEEFLEYYPRENISLPSNHYTTAYLPDIAWSNYDELRDQYADVSNLNLTGEMNTTLPEDWVIDLRRAYYSSISYIDYQIGRVLNELSNLGLDNNTIVSFVGDHGWSLGENAEWCKHTNFEQSTHTPMMIRIPGVTDGGIKTNSLTEVVDLYPTIVEAAGLSPVPLCPENSSNIAVCTEGTSMMPLTESPPGVWKNRVFSQYPRPHITVREIMGYTMRTDRYRYTEWPAWQGAPIYEPNWDVLSGVELYDHEIDPLENYNLADHTEYSTIREQLSVLLREGWRAALPSTH